jgi:hypothetical protein
VTSATFPARGSDTALLSLLRIVAAPAVYGTRYVVAR